MFNFWPIFNTYEYQNYYFLPEVHHYIIILIEGNTVHIDTAPNLYTFIIYSPSVSSKLNMQNVNYPHEICTQFIFFSQFVPKTIFVPSGCDSLLSVKGITSPSSTFAWWSYLPASIREGSRWDILRSCEWDFWGILDEMENIRKFCQEWQFLDIHLEITCARKQGLSSPVCDNCRGR